MEVRDGRGRQNQREFRYANTRLVDVVTGPNASPDGQLIPSFVNAPTATAAAAFKSRQAATTPSTLIVTIT
jgi:hypothetical protein